tara:strand:- start:204 stop:860 length:657 start_codon:yes stop_codon:yes gene_type:complete
MAHNIEHGAISIPNNAGSPYVNPTNLLDSVSKFSLVGAGAPIEDMGSPVNQEGTSLWNRGLTTGNANPLPFDATSNTGQQGHLVDLLTGDTESTRLNASSPAQSPQWMGNAPGSDLDLEGEDLDVGTGPQTFTQGLGQGDGKKLNGKDLHVEMMQATYNYTHAAGTPWATTATVGNTPSLSLYQDLTDQYVTGPNGTPADLEPSWNYNASGPSSPFNS